MAAEVSSLVRILSRYKDDRTAIKDPGPRSTVALMTRDLLGSSGCGGNEQSLELDLDLQVPNGWEKRLDLKSGKVYLQQCKSTRSSSSTHHHVGQSNKTVPRFQDLNFPPISRESPLLNLFEDTNLELKLVPPFSLSASSKNSSCQSVCTLDKVKSALERAEKDSSAAVRKKRQSPDDGVCDRNAFVKATPVAAGCPGCLSYVLVMNNSPKCPRCDTFVTLPTLKKPKIDLNISI